MLILRIISSMTPSSGGPAQGVRNLIPALQKIGIESEVVCVDPPDSDYLGDDDFPVTALGPAHTRWGYCPSLSVWLEDNLMRFDIVILHGLWQFPGFALWKALAKLSSRTGKVPPYYLYPHGMLDPWFQRDPSRKWKAQRNEVFWRLFDRRVVHGAAGVLFTCEQEMLLARETFQGYRPQAEINVGYGIPSPPEFGKPMKEAFAEACSSLPAGQPYLLFLSRIHPKKGIDLLLRAYGRLLAENGNMPHLVIAGPLESAYAEEMKKLAQGVEKDDCAVTRVHFTGMLEGDEKWGALYGCQAFVLPSHQENFGIAVVEALACGKKVLITNRVNIWREIEDANAGWVVPDSLAGLVDGLGKVLGSEDFSELDSISCYCEHFSVEGAVKSLKKLLER
ncbi:glycosyltransferase [Roseibacillus persicicus]|uniref:glycosyltransferase n=1 Tax=Roseibacillus persicicus TaxID=454148 RepID=UPI00398AEE54